MRNASSALVVPPVLPQVTERFDIAVAEAIEGRLTCRELALVVYSVQEDSCYETVHSCLFSCSRLVGIIRLQNYIWERSFRERSDYGSRGH